MSEKNKAALLCAGNLRLGAGYEHMELDYEAEGHILRLIVENNELLAALKGMMDAYCDLSDESEPNYKSFGFREARWNRARAAIAKIESDK